MTGEPTITLVGNLTADPELRFTPSGSAVANFTIASTPRTFDRQSNEWKDGETLFMRCSVWREAAENVAATLTKGMRVIADGVLKSRSYETKEGEKRTVIEFEVAEIGPSLRYATAQVHRTQNNSGQGGQGQQQDQNQWNGGGGFGGGQPQGGGGFPGAGQQQAPAQQGGGFGGWNQTAAQQQVTAQAQQAPQQAQQQRPAQQYAQAAANGQQTGAQQPYVQAPMQPQQDDPWATPGVSNQGGWGTGPVAQEPPF